MLPLSSLLNPISSEFHNSRSSTIPRSSNCTYSTPFHSLASPSRPAQRKPKMTKDGAVFAKGKIKGDVHFWPYEDLDDETAREVEKYQIYPMGKIGDYCRHIPYNSEKKNFLEKTGRESFEVFQYTFKVPGDDKEYIVMWDYNVGLVRITPFFKCCKYSKTTPAKMLNLNPGLKEITHSITGGALAAQGYWMPFSCAFAICATFCHHISGALVPIFGPTFPAHCTPTSSPIYGRMIIDASIISAATAEANSFRQQYASLNFSTPSTTKFDSASPREQPRNFDVTIEQRSSPQLRKRLRLNRSYVNDGMCTDTDASDMSASSGDRYLCSPMTPESARSFGGGGGWNATNLYSTTSTPRTPLLDHIEGSMSEHKFASAYGRTSPWLSAIPRSGGEMKVSETIWEPLPGRKRAAETDAGDEDYDGEESASESETKESEHGGAEKKAAWLLMKLSVRDGESSGGGLQVNGGQDKTRGWDAHVPRVKRRRATSV